MMVTVVRRLVHVATMIHGSLAAEPTTLDRLTYGPVSGIGVSSCIGFTLMVLETGRSIKTAALYGTVSVLDPGRRLTVPHVILTAVQKASGTVIFIFRALMLSLFLVGIQAAKTVVMTLKRPLKERMTS